MFKSIKEFFVSKPKVEEPVVIATDPAVLPPDGIETITAVQPVVEEIKPETVTLTLSDNMNFSIGQPDTIILSPPTDNTAWPFPKAQPAEVKKTRTPVKSQEMVTSKKPAPAITATKTKPRKKK